MKSDKRSDGPLREAAVRCGAGIDEERRWLLCPPLHSCVDLPFIPLVFRNLVSGTSGSMLAGCDGTAQSRGRDYSYCVHRGMNRQHMALLLRRLESISQSTRLFLKSN
ncbi:hypothetical protein E2C01_047703 [Portunus trituberculatus]|uniref:Uncharacterized protein n=1 Tax=Portunus trituberculatus TaxID=210409 RepID=A0A5B7G991_PORTR|nr:hypothetical protein [Portunus trituberculatus]